MRAAHLATLLVAHGSRDDRAQVAVERLATAVGERRGAAVSAAYIDFARPAPDEALRSLAAAGGRRIRLVPLLFTPGYHIRVDVPAAVRDSEVGEVSVAPPLLQSGDDCGELLADAVLGRLAEACDLAAVDGVALASAGSSAAGARAEVAAFAGRLSGRLDGRPVVPAYASAARPTVAEALAGLREAGAARLAVAALFVAPGRLPDAARAAADAAGAPMADPLGTHPAFVDLLARLGEPVPG